MTIQPKIPILLLTLAACTPAHAATPTEIDAAIAKAVNYLYAQQKNGHWEKVPAPKPTPKNVVTNELEEGNWGGLTGLAANALLAAGESPNNPKLKPAIDLLMKAPRANVYTLCQRDQVLAQLTPTTDIKRVLLQDGQYLLRAMETQGQAAGFYSYTKHNKEQYDHSVSQFGVLAMWTCGESVFEVPSQYWNAVERAWIRHQDPSGGWEYIYKGEGNYGKVSASMTAAGVATLFITQDYVHSDEGLTPRGNLTNPAIEKGLKWLGDNFTSVFSSGPFAPNGQYYNLYGIERCGVASGYKFFGKHDWYDEGADWLLKHQRKDGSWGDPSDLWDNNIKCIPDTALAVLFLVRGREPVMIHKLDYTLQVRNKTEDGHWNQRTRDVANVARWVGNQSERTFNWQIVNLDRTPIDDLHDASILYIAGDKPLDFTPQQDAKLRQFVQEGGLILGNPDGASSTTFIKGFQAFAARLFPDYEMRALPDSHPIYTTEQFRGPQLARKPLVSLSNGVRELMICPTTDYGRAWQARAYANDDAFKNTANIFYYLMGGQNLRKKGQSHLVRKNPRIKPDRKLALARIEYQGNFNPEPAGWTRLAAILHNEDKLDLKIDLVKLGEKKLASYKFAHLTGTAAVTFTPDQRKEIADFVNHGGTLLIDAAGGSKHFTDAIQSELAQIFPDTAGQLADPLPATDPLYQKAQPPITFTVRTWALRQHFATSEPALRAIKINNRPAVLFSPLDLSNALVGQPCDGIIGYTPDAATTLLRHLLKSAAAPARKESKP